MSDTTDIARLVDVVIAITLLELAALWIHRRLTGRGLRPDAYLANMVSGLCLMLALRGLSVDAGIGWVAAWLLAAGLAHATDIAMRLRRDARARRHDDARVDHGAIA